MSFNSENTMAQNIPNNVDGIMSNANQQDMRELHSVSKRLQKELMTLMMSNDKGISAFPDGDNLFTWIGTISGPEGTVYEGYTYKLLLAFPPTYPYTAPAVKFETPCFHPNIDPTGNICLDILKEKWSALYDVRTILISIQSLLGEPNNDSPLNARAASLWSNPEEFKKQLVNFTNKISAGKAK